MKKLIELIKQARFVFVCGNGGSASTAEHFTCDLFSKGVRAICLSSNASIMTMIANDYPVDTVFGMQIGKYATPEDLLITISCSGTSPNIVNALSVAKILGIPSYQFESFGKGKRDYEKLEDKHLKFCHQIKKLL